MPFISDAKDEAEKSVYSLGFAKGLNTIQDKTLVLDKNLILATNVQLAVDGVTRRYGTKKQFDDGSASKVWGAFSFYNRASATRRFIRVGNSRLQYLNGSSWEAVSAQAYSGAKARFVQASNKVFIYNGTDNLTSYDGSSITTYTALDTPTGLAITATGTTGSTAYSYRISAFNDVGETAACGRVSITDGNATLSSTNYNAISWDAVSGASGYNVYGRTATGFEEVYLTTVYTNSYNDTGAEAEATTKLPPEDDTTGGIIAKGAIFTLGRQFAFGVTEGSTYFPTRLYYSGTLNNIHTFNSSEMGGGWVEVGSNDGEEIVDIKPFGNYILIWKTNSIWRFYFHATTGLPALEIVTRAHGGVTFEGSQSVDNDYMFVGQKENRIAVYTIGYQANYGGDNIRTNEVTVFVSDSLEDINRTYLSNICTFYADNKFGFAYTRGSNTENDTGFVVDTRFGGWVHWDSLPMKVTSYVHHDDGENVKLYGCSANDGYMIEMLYSQRSDDGTAFRSAIGTKFHNGDQYDVEKIWRNPTLWFKYIESGTITAEVWTDGTKYQGSAILGSSSGGAGAGADLAGALIPGSMYSDSVIQNANADVVRELTMIKFGRSIGFYLIDRNVNTNWLFMGFHLVYSPLEGKPLTQSERVRVA